MKKIILPVLLSLMIVLLVMPVMANGEGDSNVTYKGGAEHFIVLPEDKDLFQNFKHMMPGESRKQIIEVRNDYSATLAFYLHAEQAPNAEQNGVYLIDILDFSLFQDGEQLYHGKLRGSVPGMSEDILLGELKKGESVKLEAFLSAPGAEMDNRYQLTKAAVNWVFTVEIMNAAMDQIRNVGDCFD